MSLFDLPLNKVPAELHEYWITLKEAVPPWGWWLVLGILIVGVYCG